MSRGCDISQYQGEIEPEWFDRWDFVIIRAFDRWGDLDERFHENWSKAAGRTRRGAYGWPKPGADNYAMGASLAAVAPDAEFGLWADYEHSLQFGLASEQDLQDYLDGMGPREKGVYSNIPTYPSVADPYPWWMANYGSNNGFEHEPSLPPPRAWDVYQYTSNGLGPNSRLDLNIAVEPIDWRRGQTDLPVMREVWYPNAERLDGAHSDYSAGKIHDLRAGIGHYTVGYNSKGTCGRDFQFLVSRDGTVWQGCPIDAVCWGSGDPWNGFAVHIEVEYRDEDTIFTHAAREATRKLVQWIHSEWGVPLAVHYKHEGRIPDWNGFIDHGALIQTGDWHSDYWPVEDWNYITGVTDTRDVTTPKVAAMYIAVGRTIYSVPIAFLVSGDLVLSTFRGDASNIFGIPQDALDWKARGGTDAVPFIYVTTNEVNAFLDIVNKKKG